VDSIDDERLGAIRAARARVRQRAWAAGAAPARIVLDIDSTLVTAHSDKEGAAPTYKAGYGHHPILCYLGGQALAGMLRPGNAGANTAADHIGVLVDALDQLPEAVREDSDTEILVRAEAAGCTHDFLDAVVQMECSFSVGMAIDERARQTILALPEAAWTPAIRQDGTEREGAWVAELAGLDLSGWPEGSPFPMPRAIASRCCSPTRKTTRSPSRPAIAPARASRTRSAPPRTRGFPTCPFASSPPTPPGWSWC
jgi:hypothetical protein